MITKVLLVCLKYSYGEKKLGESINKGALHDSFTSLGYQVETVWIDEHDPKDLKNELFNKAETYNPDLILFKLFRDEISVETLEQLRRKYLLVNWFGDDQWRFDNYSSKYARYFNMCITTDKFSFQKYRELGQKNVILSQHASFDNSAEYQDVSYEYDVSFIGGNAPYRSWFIDQLRRRGLNIACFGRGWERGSVTYKKMDEIILTSKINLNLSNSTCFDYRFNLSARALPVHAKSIIRKILNPRSETKNVSQMKARVFEIPVRGGFLISEFVPSLGDYYEIDKEIVCYTDIDEAALLINYYLENDDERERIKNAGVVKARGTHTYKHRTLAFMKKIEQYKNDAA